MYIRFNLWRRNHVNILYYLKSADNIKSADTIIIPSKTQSLVLTVIYGGVYYRSSPIAPVHVADIPESKVLQRDPVKRLVFPGQKQIQPSHNLRVMANCLDPDQSIIFKTLKSFRSFWNRDPLQSIYFTLDEIYGIETLVNIYKNIYIYNQQTPFLYSDRH